MTEIEKRFNWQLNPDQPEKKTPAGILMQQLTNYSDTSTNKVALSQQ